MRTNRKPMDFQNKARWYGDCQNAKMQKNKRLTSFRATNSQHDLEVYLTAKRNYKNLCNKKEKQYKETMQRNIRDAANDPNKCWKVLKGFKTLKTVSPIEPSNWVKHFSSLLNAEITMETDWENLINEYLSDHDNRCESCDENLPVEINDNITLDEVKQGVRHLANNKSPGKDGIMNELLKNSEDIVAPILLELFNKLLDTGRFPKSWCEAIIMPIYKKGPKDKPSNYRGISLLSNVAKIFTKILNSRCVKWAEANGKFYEVQAGFRKDRSTLDQIFAVQSIVEKYLSKKGGRFYYAFIDFSTAFDSVPHKHLWFKLHRTGLHGNIINVLKSMYENLKSCVMTDGGLTEMFEIIRGTRQGCMLSPFLFNMYLNELVDMCEEHCQGVFIDELFPNLVLLL